jgi:hypothetical protein
MMKENADREMKVTPAGLVLPFYLYAAVSFLVCTLLLFFSAENLTSHYFHPHSLAITHIAALGWGTMIILGASHQLLPVFSGRHLFSPMLARISFLLAALGIPMLVYAFYQFDFGWAARLGGGFVVAAVACFFVNVAGTILRGAGSNIQNAFMFTATAWLLATVVIGWLLVINFTTPILPAGSLDYLSLHAHTGMVGWFLLMVMGVSSRLLPMFLLSKYTGTRLLKTVFFLVNAGLLAFVVQFFSPGPSVFILPLYLLLLAFIVFGVFCLNTFRARLRKRLDGPMKVSLLSVCMMFIPFLVLTVIIYFSLKTEVHPRFLLMYGFVIFFGWLTAIILGMTFKTLPFIIWNRRYEASSGIRPTPSPQDLFAHSLFRWMMFGYLAGFFLFITGVWLVSAGLLTVASALLMGAAVLYNWNVIKLLTHKPRAL